MNSSSDNKTMSPWFADMWVKSDVTEIGYYESAWKANPETSNNFRKHMKTYTIFNFPIFSNLSNLILENLEKIGNICIETF